MKNPRLTHALANRLEEGLKSLPNLEEVVIIKPPVVTMFPHLPSIRRLKLEGIPRDCEDWEWLLLLTQLEDIQVSICSTRSTVSDGSTDFSSTPDDQEGLHVQADQAEIWSVTTWALTVYEKLPTTLREKV